MNKLKVCIAGATGWAGSALSKGVFQSEKMELVSAVSRQNAGENLSEVLDFGAGNIPIFDQVESALAEVACDVLVEYTKPGVAKANVLAALEKGINVVVGTSGLSEANYQEIEKAAVANNTSVLAVGNFAITAVLMQKFSVMAAKYIPNYEVIDYSSEGKVDVPSGTARELASRLSKVQESTVFVAAEDLMGVKETRGGRLNGVQVHSVRLPGYVLSIESLFGLKDEKLTIRHDAGSSAEPYVLGALLAIEKVGTFKGFKRGLDSVMEF